MAQSARAPATAKAAPKREQAGPTVAPPKRVTAPAAPRIPPRQMPCACGGHCPKCQRAAACIPPIAVSENTAAEKEAEQIATLLVQAFATAPIPPPEENRTRPTGRRVGSPAGRGRDAAVSRKKANSGPGLFEGPRTTGPALPAITPTSRPDSSLGAGSPLPEPIRRRLEPLLGFDLGAIRLHTDSAADRLAAHHGARAFAFGSHLVFGRGEYAPHHATGRNVLVHEIVHAVQQTPAAGDPWSHGALSLSARPRGPPQRGLSPLSVRHRLAAPQVQRLPSLPSLNDVRNGLSTAGDAVVGVGSSAVDLAVDLGEGAVELCEAAIERTADFFIGLIDDYAPGLLEFLRGGFATRLTSLFCRGLDAVIGGLVASLEGIDFMSALEQAFASAQGGVEGVIGAIQSGASSALGSLMQPVVEALNEYGPGIIEAITGASDSVNGFFDSIWESIGAPALDFLGEAGGAIWEEVTTMVDWLWDATAGVREAASDAWAWVMEQFGLAWESTTGIRDWLAEKAAAVWDTMKEALGPLEGPITTLLGVLIILSPLGPIVIATQVIPPLWEKLVWLWNNWNTDDILVWAQDTLREDILPGIIGLVSGVASAIANAASWIAGITGQVAGAFGRVLGVFGGNECLVSVTRVLNAVSAQFGRLAAWAEGGFTGLADSISHIFHSIVAMLQPILDFLIRLFLVAANPPLLPIALAAAIWLLIPDDLKPPVINFVLDLIVAFLRGFPAFLTSLGPLASILQAGFLGFLEGLRAAEDQRKIDASNKVANLMAGAGLRFVAGFAVGILEGLLDGILDPFRLIWMLVQFLSRLCRSIGDYLAPLLFAASPDLGTAVGDFNASVRASIPDHPPAHAPPAEAAAPSAVGEISRAAPGARVGPTAASPPTGGSSLSSAPAASPEDAIMADVLSAGPTASDADLVASLSPGLAGQLTGAAGDLDGAATEGEASAESETRSEGGSIGGLSALLGGIWTAIIDGAHGLGGRAAGALLEFIMLPDYELGNKIGYVAGLVLLEVIVAYFSGGVSAELKAAEPFIKAAIRFLDLGGEILGLLGRAVRPIRGPLLRGFSAVGEHLGRFRFLQPILQRIRRAADVLFHFGDEAAEAAGHAGSRADDVARRADAVADAARSGRRADDAASAARRTDPAAGVGRRADDVPHVGDDAARTGGPTSPHGDDAARAARKAAEMPAALAAAQAICEANDRIDTPPPLLWAELLGLRARFSWIETFRVTPKTTPGHFEIHLIASDTTVDRDYTFFRVGPDEMDELVDFWRQRVDRLSGPRRAEAEAYLRRLRDARRRGTPPRTRPTWWQTEAEVGHFYDEAGDALGTMANRARRTRDVPYIHGRDAHFIRRSDGSLVRDDLGRPLYQRGHTRPDIVYSSHAIEVKNYRLTEPGDVDRLARTLEHQVGDRASLHVGSGPGRGGLPADISRQGIVIDARGQSLTDAQLREVGDTLIARLNRRLDTMAASGDFVVNRQRFTPDDIQFIVYGSTVRRSAAGPAPTRVPASVHDAIRHPGRSLPPPLRHRAESFFGADLGHVRLHDDDLAATAAAQSHAHALASGSHILLGRDRRDCSRPATLSTLTHELAHTLQPAGPGGTPIAFEPDHSPAEQAARTAAAQFAARPGSAPPQRSAVAASRIGTVMREPTEDAVEARREQAVRSIDFMDSIPPIVLDDNAPVLIAWARKQAEKFDRSAGTAEQQLYLAQGILKAYKQLKDFEGRADRGPDGALVYRNRLTETETPWTDSGEKRLDEIAPFTPLDLIRWNTSAQPLPTAAGARRRRQPPPTRRQAKARTQAPPPANAVNITFSKQKDMNVSTEEGQQLIMAFVIASTRRGLSSDQIGWLASQLSADKEKRWQPPPGMDRATWEAEFDAIPVGGSITLTITHGFTFEVDHLMTGMPSQRDFMLEGYRQGVLAAESGLYLGIGTFAVGTLAFGGAAAFGTLMSVAGGAGVTVPTLIGQGARYYAVQAYLNAPAIYGNAQFLLGAGSAAVTVYHVGNKIAHEGAEWSDLGDLAGAGVSLYGGYADRRYYNSYRTPSTPTTPSQPDGDGPAPAAPAGAAAQPIDLDDGATAPASSPTLTIVKRDDSPAPTAITAPATAPPAAPARPPASGPGPASTPASNVIDLATWKSQRPPAIPRSSPSGGSDGGGGGGAYIGGAAAPKLSPAPTPAPASTAPQPTPKLSSVPMPQGSPAPQSTPQVAPNPAVQPVPQPQTVPAPAALPTPPSPRPIGPAPDPSRTVVTLAPTAANTGSSQAPTSGSAPAAAPQPAPNPTQNTNPPPVQVRLILPSQKSIHLSRYQALVRERRLIHQVGVGRQDNGQRDRWDRNLRPNGRQGINRQIWDRFAQMGVSEIRRLRPNWTQTREYSSAAGPEPMEVDHIVDDQVCRWLPNNGWYREPSNLELLDRAANGAAGTALDQNITAERQRLVGLTNNPAWLTMPLTFTTVLSSSGPTGERWLADELEQGLHYHALRRLLNRRSGVGD